MFKLDFNEFFDKLKANNIDTEKIDNEINDIIIKTLISAEGIISTATEMYVKYKDSWFELLGFDILIDDNFKCWLWEVNLNPSLTCDSDLDLYIKSNLIADMFNLVGVKQNEPRSGFEICEDNIPIRNDKLFKNL